MEAVLLLVVLLLAGCMAYLGVALAEASKRVSASLDDAMTEIGALRRVLECPHVDSPEFEPPVKDVVPVKPSRPRTFAEARRVGEKNLADGGLN